MQAIRTRYHGHTNSKCSSIRAKSCGGFTQIVPYDDELSMDRNHEIAALLLCERLGWTHYMEAGLTHGVFGGDYYWIKKETA